MAGATQAVRSTTKSRVYDYVYDGHYTVASERDLNKPKMKAQMNLRNFGLAPVFRSMFSDITHYPRMELRLTCKDQIPSFVNQNWKGNTVQCREAVIRYRTFEYDLPMPVLREDLPFCKFVDVDGQDRFQFSARPVISSPDFVGTPPRPIISSPDFVGTPPSITGKCLEDVYAPATRTVEIQTVFRESESQTDPYTPEFIVLPGETPELLTLATLCFGHGLPAGLAEVKMIERNRAKRAYEESLPPARSLSHLVKRYRMMLIMETKEWVQRDRDIEKINEARLNILMKLLNERKEAAQKQEMKRLDLIWASKQKTKLSCVKKIRNEYMKAIRRLTRQRQDFPKRCKVRDIIQDYTCSDSQVFAPLTRLGAFPDHGSEKFVVKSKHLSTYEGLLELEASLPEFVLNPRISTPDLKEIYRNGHVCFNYSRKKQQLAETHENVKKLKAFRKKYRSLKRIDHLPVRPQTPETEILENYPRKLLAFESKDNEYQAATLLQQVIRGRAIQSMMFNGKEERRELIQEIKTTNALQEIEIKMREFHKCKTLSLQDARDKHEHMESLVSESIAALEGKSLGEMFDFLSSELVRLEEERRVHAFAMLAERTRRMKEARESGRRQFEIRRRREEDEIFKQLLKIHQMTVDSYLEGIIMVSVDKISDDQAKREVQKQLEAINEVAYKIEGSQDQLHSDEIVANLVYCFLIPEVKKATVQEKIRLSQKRFLQQAHVAVYEEGTGILAVHRKRTLSDSVRRKPERIYEMLCRRSSGSPLSVQENEVSSDPDLDAVKNL